uniref:Integrin alpha-2-like n=1 Tax=Sinocyclocheilus grahami TaxID=75366 RepID=A0A672NP86_SINGR
MNCTIVLSDNILHVELSCFPLPMTFLYCFCIAHTQGFNVGTAGAKIFSGLAVEEFGYNVQQISNDQGKWLLVGSPWSGYPQNRKGNLYKCDISASRRATCQKLNLAGKFLFILNNYALAKTDGMFVFQTCGPLWAQRCGSQYFYPGICAEVSPQFTLQSSFSPAIQSTSYFVWSEMYKILYRVS